jgi:hypothetical protein
MKKTHLLALTFAGTRLSGCASQKPVMATVEYAAKEPIATSLFSSDQAVLGDEAVERILSSKLELPAKAKVALMKFPDADGSRYYGSYYWRDEEYLKFQQMQGDTLSKALLASDQIVEVTPLPSLLTRDSCPSRSSVRRPCECKRICCGCFVSAATPISQYRAFTKDKVKRTARADGSGSLHARRQPERVELNNPPTLT